jgi:hypothetical protein
VDDAGTGEVVHVRAVTSYTALLFVATVLCGVLNITPRLLYPREKERPVPIEKELYGPFGWSGRFRSAEVTLCPWYPLSL